MVLWFRHQWVSLFSQWILKWLGAQIVIWTFMTKWLEWKRVGGERVCALYLLLHYCRMKQGCQMSKYPTGYTLMKMIFSKLSSFPKVCKVTTWVRLTVLSYNRACRDSPLVRVSEPISCRVQTGNWKYRDLCLKQKNIEINVYNWKT